MIEGRGLIQLYGRQAGATASLRGLDLDVAQGEIVAIIGPSGSGKSTLLRLLAAAERPSSGTLHVMGLPLERASEIDLRRYRQTSVALVEQHYRRALSPYLPAGRQVALPLRIRGWDEARATVRARELLDRLGVLHRVDAPPSRLSGGEQQRVAVAAALAIGPQLLLADEPTGELDAETAAALLESLRDLVRAQGATCVIVTHDEAVERVADRVLVLQDGRIVAERSGGKTRIVTDSAGWRAPEPFAPPRLVGAAAVPAARETPAAAGPVLAVRLESLARAYPAGDAERLGLAPTTAAFSAVGIHTITGPSGSGKSTLLRLISGLDRPTSGRVETLGVDLATLDREALAALRATRIALVDQARPLVPFLGVSENVELALAIRGVVGDEARTRAAETLESLGIAGLALRRPDELSAGERTRASLARALASRPDLLLLDEPTATLDRRTAAAIADLIAGLRGVTVIAATHDPALVDIGTDRLDLMRRPTAGPPG